ncbi:tetratricopeptide repeat protein [Agriterribacter sp.]|uniref:tetratricopeptide repeat protein n=1 Tax=Agriterribacter sp. TaxID=2821509 RepID=UPI002B95B94B|nr:tetratricopeptide repeat protein [Agriterribacter sp.]HRP56001.1 tetratricopeptide repeat protein [Agriterribacter sp.]
MKNPERIDSLLLLLERSKDDSFLKHALALEYIKKNNDTEARKLLESVLENDPAYVGSYYQLAKLLERAGDAEAALKWYERGMTTALQSGNQRTFNELRAAYEELKFE